MAGISITLAGNFGKLDELKAKSQKAAAAIKSSFSGTVGSAMFKGVGAAALATFAAVVASIKSAIDAGGELTDMMARTGASGAGLVVMKQAFKNVGLEAAQVPQAINRMQKALSGANEDGEETSNAFGKLGLSISELRDLDPVAAFQQIAASIASIKDPSDRTAAAMEIFGKSGASMLAIMNDPNAFQVARDQVGSLAETLTGVAGEFDTIGDAAGTFQVKVQQLGTRIGVALLPVLNKMVEVMDAIDLGSFDWKNPFSTELTPEDRKRAVKMAEDSAKNDPMFGKSRTEVAAQKKAAQAADAAAKDSKEVQKAADLAAKKAESEREAEEAKERSRAAAVSEYALEADILRARLAGQKYWLEALEREKKVRAEMQKLEGAGFTAEEVRQPAEAKVDAEQRAADKDEARKKLEDERKKTAEDLTAKREEVAKRLDHLQYQTTVGRTGSMQRIGGGGGAVGTGLDYQRQLADLQRESNELLRQIADQTRPIPD